MFKLDEIIDEEDLKKLITLVSEHRQGSSRRSSFGKDIPTLIKCRAAIKAMPFDNVANKCNVLDRGEVLRVIDELGDLEEVRG